MARPGSARLVADIAALALLVAAMVPSATGVAAHEWLGIVAAGALVAHAARRFAERASRSSIAPSASAEAGESKSAFAAAPSRPPSGPHGARGARRALLALDALMGIVLMACLVSGIMISGDVLRVFGLYAPGYYFWDPLHAASAKALAALLIAHIAMHAGWMASIARSARGRVSDEGSIS